MEIFDKILGNLEKKRDSKAIRILILSLMSSKLMLERNQISNGAIFEVVLFSSLFFLRRLRQKLSEKYSNLEEEYFMELYTFAKDEGILNKIPCEFKDFVKSRFQFYGYQVNAMSEKSDGVFLSTKVAYYFYKAPLSLSSGDIFDLQEIMRMNIKNKHFFEFLENSVPIVIDTKYSNSFDNESYSEANIKIKVEHNANKIFAELQKTKKYFGLSGHFKNYADEYLKSISFITAGAILANKLINKGFTEKDEEYKRILRTVYYNNLYFFNIYVKTGLIEYSIFNKPKEEDLLVTTLIKFENFLQDIQHFIATNEPCYIGEMEEDDDFGTYFDTTQYSFIKETHQVNFRKTQTGISLEFDFEDYDDENGLEDSIIQTLQCIKKIIDE